MCETSMAVAQDDSKAGVGDRMAAFDAFVDARRDAAVRFAFRLLRGDSDAAEDVVQNALLRAHRGLPRFRQESSLDTWFYRILIREVHRYRRWYALRRVWSGESLDPPEIADERPVGDPGLRRRITTALGRLTNAQREAFVLVHMEGLSIAQAAAILGKAVGTVKSHLHRALESLRADLADLVESKKSSGKISGGET